MGDPVTTSLIISASMSVVSGYSQIQSAKATGKAQRAEYERQKKINNLNALQEENRRNEQADSDRSNNLAIFGATGLDPASRSFMGVQSQVDRIAKKDISNIRLNALSTNSQLNTASYISRVNQNAKVVGGYASIIKGTTSAYGKYDAYNTKQLNEIYPADKGTF